MATKKRRRLKKGAKLILIVFAAVLIGLLGLAAWNFGRVKSPAAAGTPEPTAEPAAPEPTPDLVPDWLDIGTAEAKYRIFRQDHEINSEVKAYVYFTSGLIEQPVVQSSDNSKYLTVNWEDMSYRSYGSAFMDYRNNPEIDENIIIYGHYVYERRSPDDRTLMFTPLALLRDESVYPDNRMVVLMTEDHLYGYELAYVYDCPLVPTEYGDMAREDLQFNLTEYDSDYFAAYTKAIEDVQLYDTGVEIADGERMLSLQTCIEWHEESRQIAVCRQIFTMDIPEEWR